METKDGSQKNNFSSNEAPVISLPKGGGAIRGLGEKFNTNPITGTGSLDVPIYTSPGRSEFGPQLTLSYDSAAGNGPFGFGWNLSLPSITRKTDKGIPKYQDANDSDVYILSGMEDLVPVTSKDGKRWSTFRICNGVKFKIQRYRPRIEGLFSRIEHWTNQSNPKDTFWRSISKDNITNWYGKTDNSRITDPSNPTRIFRWLICESYDDKGNVMVYRYKEENSMGVDLSQIHEKNRNDQTRSANRYLKSIKYGNCTPHYPVLTENQPSVQLPKDWLFEVILDYGEHDQDTPTPDEKYSWSCRKDAFSTYRSGFEIRTYRTCQRVLMFHHFPEEPGVGKNCLVRSTDFTYSHEQNRTDDNKPILLFLSGIKQTGYKRKTEKMYLHKSFPPLEFQYSHANINEEIQHIDPESLKNLPIGLDGGKYRWVDLDGEGVSGILTEQGNSWFYKRNLSPINFRNENRVQTTAICFGPAERVAELPFLTADNQYQLLDLSGDGRLDLVRFQGPSPGFNKRTVDGRWEPFRPFKSLPVLDWAELNLKFIDLTGDGHADIIMSKDDVVWYPSLGEEGFGPLETRYKPFDEEKGPRLVFADSAHYVYLADMSGDGLTDLVRICNEEVCYWPNLGYGRFGDKVTMDNAPWFDSLDQFNQQYIRLADIDGTGVTDIIYLGCDGVRLYFNQSGNRWSKPYQLSQFPLVNNLSSVTTIDLLGNGTTCLVWSSPLPGDVQKPMRYVDLMGGQKPYLLTKVINNLGAETLIEYAPSTKFYLKDKQEGKPWITKLPFPVHCVEKVTVHDKWRNTTFSNTYSYHHGYFDGQEREFRGFGRIEQVDVEEYGVFTVANSNSPYITVDQTLYQPPIKTVTWYHTGAFLDRERIFSHFKDEYFPNWFEEEQSAKQVLGAFRENVFPEPKLDTLDLTTDEWREALRACKGMMLRQEVYELDVDGLTGNIHKPVKIFSVSNRNYDIHRVQPKLNNLHAVFHVTESESITYHYELDFRNEELTPDPRIVHTLNLSRDEYGNIQQSLNVAYPRLKKYIDAKLKEDVQTLIQQVQSDLHISYIETYYTNDVPNYDLLDLDTYRLRLPCEVLTYELTGINHKQSMANITECYFTLDKLRAYKLSDKYQKRGVPVEEIAYHLLPNGISPQKRMVEHVRMLFFDTTLDKPLELGKLNALAIPYESYKLAFTDDILGHVYKDKIKPEVQSVLTDKKKSGYLTGSDLAIFSTNTTGQYWMCSGVVGFNADAPKHFYLPESYTDPFRNLTITTYDPYDLFIQSSTDALGSRTEVTKFDFRVLAPCQMKDVNDNLSEVRFDILGLHTAMAVMGKGSEADNLDGFDDELLNPDLDTLQNFFVYNDYNTDDAKRFLRSASTRYLYYFGEIIEDGKTIWGQHPACACGIGREQHSTDETSSPVQCGFEYSDGTGNVLVKKMQAELEAVSGLLRWVVTGKIVLNNKGKPVKQYEPYFSLRHQFEILTEVGMATLMYYDAAGRVTRTEMPDGSYSRVEFSPWHATHYDANDTVRESGNAWYTQKSAPTATRENQRAARLTIEHADTPLVTVLDSLGREVISIAHNRVGPADTLIDQKYVTFTRLDAEGKPLWVQDSRGNRVMQYIMPPLLEGVRPFNDINNLNLQGFVPCYDIAGNLLFQHSMDSGDHWILNDAAGKPMFSWDSRSFVNRMTYDELHRLTGSFVTGADPTNPAREIQFEKLVYGEGADNDKKYNLRGKLHEHFETAGVVTNESYDFKGNLLRSIRQLTVDYKEIPDWSKVPQTSDLEVERFVTSTRYDALNRPIQIIAPYSTAVIPRRINVTQPAYNEAGLLKRVDVWYSRSNEPTELLDVSDASQHLVKNIKYNARGQRLQLQYGNGTETSYDYETDTFRLNRLKTTRKGDCALLQDLNFTYDPVGNITEVHDYAQNRVFHNNQCVLPGAKYRYDALYRLIAASGREHKGNGQQYDWDDSLHSVSTLPNDCQSLQNYVEAYCYDEVGNIIQMVHHAGHNFEKPGQVIWNRRYQYALDSNRLLATSLPGDPVNLPNYVVTPRYSAKYTYDKHGNITEMPHLLQMSWNFRNQLSTTARMINNDTFPTEKAHVKTYYVYSSDGQRVRKVTETQTGAISKERIYLGGFEIFREYNNGIVKLEQESLHVMDDKQRIALVEMQTIKNQSPIAKLQPLVRYQLSNHLNSVTLELDENASVITYEEYTPFGSTAYCAGRNVTERSIKRYRYTGKERDVENGLFYHGARYYAPWLGRWMNSDPAGMIDGVNLFVYSSNNPIIYKDSTGMQSEGKEKKWEYIDPAEVVQGETFETGATGAALGVIFVNWLFGGISPSAHDFGVVLQTGIHPVITRKPTMSMAPEGPPTKSGPPTGPPAKPAAPAEPPAKPAVPTGPPTKPAAPAEPPTKPAVPTGSPIKPAAPVEPPTKPAVPTGPPTKPVAPDGPPVKGTGEIGWSMPKGGGIINGRKYSEHALERMAPNTLEVRAELSTRAHQKATEKGLKFGTKEYHEFVTKYVDPRGITPTVVEDAIKNTPIKPGKYDGTFTHQNEKVTVITNNNGDIVTVIPR
ncbi:toxin [Bacillus sp. 17RED48]|uniref:SpvB/TcaC N-terminal domain-containing protein n=1 Tax=Bacillus sp. 17RED48 TaxID=2778093 RepID=UPI001C9A7DBF|nr:SpvB/TcaC N-terminal domain-containing protein [Bacillus sp. 17RED48]MBY7110689.1 toxin [Bacillus sp. 17RED48]